MPGPIMNEAEETLELRTEEAGEELGPSMEEVPGTSMKETGELLGSSMKARDEASMAACLPQLLHIYTASNISLNVPQLLHIYTASNISLNVRGGGGG